MIQKLKKQIADFESQIEAIRKQRSTYVSGVLDARQKEVDKIASITGDQKKAELIPSDYQVIEETFNKPIAAVKEKIRLLAGELGQAEIPVLDGELEKALDVLDQKKAEAAQLIAEAEGHVAGIEIRIKAAKRAAAGITDRSARIRFEPRSAALVNTKTLSKDKNAIQLKILNY